MDLAVGPRVFLPIVADGGVLVAGESVAGITRFSLR